MTPIARMNTLKRLRKAIQSVRNCITALEEAERAGAGVASERISGYAFGLGSGYTEGILDFADRIEGAS